jgi:hypothetical protein
MAVGTTANFDVTRTELIDLALGIIGVTEATQSDYSLAIKVLNSLIRYLDADGHWLHAIDSTESTLTLVSSQREYAAGAGASNIATNILRLEYIAVLEGAEDYRELVILDTPQSFRTLLKDDSNGEPSAVHLERAKLLTDNKIQFFPTPNSAYTVKYNYRRPLFDFDLATDNPDFPSPFILPLQKRLAVELAPHFGNPLPERQLLLAEAEAQFEQAKSFHADKPSYVPLQTEYF